MPFQSPEGDSLFFYEFTTAERIALTVFQSPEGDSLFFYFASSYSCSGATLGFQSPEGDSLFFYRAISDAFEIALAVSVPRRGFVVFLLTIEFYPVRRILFQSPEGDSLFFYLFYLILDCAIGAALASFSPPKGIRCFSTRLQEERRRIRILLKFQSPEGDSLFFYVQKATPEGC